jgi:PAS domain S-box-containing protein
LVIAVLGGAVVPAEAQTTAPAPTKDVLVLYSTRRDAPMSTVGDRELPLLLEQGLDDNLSLYSEYIDQGRFPAAGYQEAFSSFLRVKYSGRRFDLVIGIQDAAVAFLDQYRLKVFPDTPVVFLAISPPARRLPNSTGVIAELDLARTLALAVQLQPDVRNVFVVSGAGVPDKRYESLARSQLRPFESKLAVTYLAGLSAKDLEARLATLPDDSIVYYLVVYADATGEIVNPSDYLKWISAMASAPTYSWVDTAMGSGIVGGSLLDAKTMMSAVSVLALRVIKGEAADTIPVSSPNLHVSQVDWRQVRRWGIGEDRVPVGTTVLFRQPTVFEEYKTYIVGTIGVVTLQTILIGGLMVQRRRRRLAEELLRESEQRFRLVADTAPVMIWRSGPDRLRDFFNLPWLRFRGRSFEEEVGDGWIDGVHAEDRDYCVSTYVQSFERRESLRVEYRLRRADGEYAWVLDTGVPRHSSDGIFSGYIGSCIDITERKQAEEALRTSEVALRASNAQIQQLAGRLITAQEAERSRIARELHDDISQEMALLTMDLELLGRASRVETGPLSAEALNRAQRIANTVRNLSHRLHPAKARLIGLVPALHALRHELANSDIAIHLTDDDVPSAIPPEVTMCLFRIAQEALQNAVKHSRARNVLVHLHGRSEGLLLDIIDDGVGFDVAGAWGKGLGLISMSERLDAIGGKLNLESEPGAGTRLHVTVPAAVIQRPASISH